MNIKKNISNFEDDDLNEMAPNLSKSGRISPLITNDDYFNSFCSKLEGSITDFEEMKTEAPVLSNIPKYNPFGTPINYFDDLPIRVQETIINKITRPSFWEWVIPFLKPNFAIPVLTTLLIAFAGIRYIEKQNEATTLKIEYQLSEEEQLNMIDESYIIEEILSTSSTEKEVATEKHTGIENYLIDENIDETNLNNEL